MKRISAFFLAAALVLSCSVLFAATTRYFTRFSCIVPTDWYAEENNDGSVYLYSNYNANEMIWIDVGEMGRDSLEDVALDYYDQTLGRDFRSYGDYYSFTYSRGGYTWYADVVDYRTQPNLPSNVYCIISTTSYTDPEDAQYVLDSILVNDRLLYGYEGTSSGGGGGGCNSGLASLFGLLAGLALLRKK